MNRTTSVRDGKIKSDKTTCYMKYLTTNLFQQFNFIPKMCSLFFKSTFDSTLEYIHII